MHHLKSFIKHYKTSAHADLLILKKQTWFIFISWLKWIHMMIFSATHENCIVFLKCCWINVIEKSVSIQSWFFTFFIMCSLVIIFSDNHSTWSDNSHCRANMSSDDINFFCFFYTQCSQQMWIYLNIIFSFSCHREILFRILIVFCECHNLLNLLIFSLILISCMSRF